LEKGFVELVHEKQVFIGSKDILSLWKIGAWVVPVVYPGPKVQEAYDEQGTPADQEATEIKSKAIFR